ncbi:hypothetical protein [Flavobacterium antarcticum]|uniref:hypothetical protein n=1 Tax=Flavobacterium antarcticum TaxID=271155 RepID=UPI0003B680EE|nr:hypothetical protein [Flavobacterium antarcticum]
MEELKVWFEMGEYSAKTLLTDKEYFGKIDKSKEQAKNRHTKSISKQEKKGLLGL